MLEDNWYRSNIDNNFKYFLNEQGTNFSDKCTSSGPVVYRRPFQSSQS